MQQSVYKNSENTSARRVRSVQLFNFSSYSLFFYVFLIFRVMLSVMCLVSPYYGMSVYGL